MYCVLISPCLSGLSLVRYGARVREDAEDIAEERVKCLRDIQALREVKMHPSYNIIVGSHLFLVQAYLGAETNGRGYFFFPLLTHCCLQLVPLGSIRT